MRSLHVNAGWSNDLARNDHAPGKRLCLGLVVLLAAQTLHAGGFLYFVNTTSDTVVVGACENGNAGCSLRGAISAANNHPGADGIEIDLPPGSVVNLTQALPDITESVSISGPGADNFTVRRSTSALYRIFNVTATGAVSFSGMTIRDGFLVGDLSGGRPRGGNKEESNGTLNVTNCTVVSNTVGAVGRGAGIANFIGGTLNVTNTIISGNVMTGTIRLSWRRYLQQCRRGQCDQQHTHW